MHTSTCTHVWISDRKRCFIGASCTNKLYIILTYERHYRPYESFAKRERGEERGGCRGVAERKYEVTYIYPSYVRIQTNVNVIYNASRQYRDVTQWQYTYIITWNLSFFLLHRLLIPDSLLQQLGLNDAFLLSLFILSFTLSTALFKTLFVSVTGMLPFA